MKTRAAEVFVVSLMCAAILWLMPRIVQAGPASPVGEPAGTNNARKIQKVATANFPANKKNEQSALVSPLPLSTNSSASPIKKNIVTTTLKRLRVLMILLRWLRSLPGVTADCLRRTNPCPTWWWLMEARDNFPVRWKL